jgi:hypothetical protein
VNLTAGEKTGGGRPDWIATRRPVFILAEKPRCLFGQIRSSGLLERNADEVDSVHSSRDVGIQ